MRCHYITVKGHGRVHIPGCYQGIYHPDQCTCPKNISVHAADRQEVKELKNRIKDLEMEYFTAWRIIKKLGGVDPKDLK